MAGEAKLTEKTRLKGINREGINPDDVERKKIAEEIGEELVDKWAEIVILKVINMKKDENGDFILSGKPGYNISITARPTVEDWVLIIENKKESNIIKD